MIDEKVLIAREAEVQAEVVKRLQGIKRRADMGEFEKNCLTCRFGQQDDGFCYPCTKCDTSYSSWESCIWLTYWLSSFDTNSATECFTAVNILKQRLEEDI